MPVGWSSKRYSPVVCVSVCNFGTHGTNLDVTLYLCWKLEVQWIVLPTLSVIMEDINILSNILDFAGKSLKMLLLHLNILYQLRYLPISPLIDHKVMWRSKHYINSRIIKGLSTGKFTQGGGLSPSVALFTLKGWSKDPVIKRLSPD